MKEFKCIVINAFWKVGIASQEKGEGATESPSVKWQRLQSLTQPPERNAANQELEKHEHRCLIYIYICISMDTIVCFPVITVGTERKFEYVSTTSCRRIHIDIGMYVYNSIHVYIPIYQQPPQDLPFV